MGMDALGSCIIRISIANMLTIQNKWVSVLQQEGFQPPTASQWQWIDNANRMMSYKSHNSKSSMVLGSVWLKVIL